MGSSVGVPLLVGEQDAADADERNITFTLAGDDKLTLGPLVSSPVPGSPSQAANWRVSIVVDGELDFETAPALNMTVFATDSGWDGRPLTTAAWVAVDVADVNEAPRLHDGSLLIELDVPRDLPKGSTLDILSTRVVDEDLPKQSLAYALVGPFQLRDASAMEWYESPLPWLRLDELQGTLVLNTSAAYCDAKRCLGDPVVCGSVECGDEFASGDTLRATLRVSDGAADLDASLELNLTDPTGRSPPSLLAPLCEVAEDAVSGTLVCTMNATVEGQDVALLYSLEPSHISESFTLDETAGELRVSSVASLDHETDGGQLEVVVRVVEDREVPLRTLANVPIAVLDVNEPPVVPVHVTTVLAQEDASPGSVLGCVIATDPEDDNLTCAAFSLLLPPFHTRVHTYPGTHPPTQPLLFPWCWQAMAACASVKALAWTSKTSDGAPSTSITAPMTARASRASSGRCAWR